jgi:acetylornithine deacetylase/succinyl-diaminopimelate desuccinylase-like protein
LIESSPLNLAQEAGDQLVELCAHLVRIPSPNPPGDTRAVAAFVRRHLAGEGLEVQGYTPDPRRPNLVAEVQGSEGGPHVVLNSHLDTFPPAFADVDIRVPMGGDSRWIIARVREAIRASGVDCEVDVLMAGDPTLTDPGSEFVQLLRQEAEQVLGRTLHPAVRVGASDARLFRAAGVPTVVYGPAPRNMGTRDEYVEIDELRTVARIYARTLAQLTGRR